MAIEHKSETDNYLWARYLMPGVYQEAKQINKRYNKKIIINLPLTWETLCLIDAIRDKFEKVTVVPLSSGNNSSLQIGVFKYLKKWNIDFFRTSSAANKKAALTTRPDIILDCTFSISRFGFENKLIPKSTFVIEDTRTGGIRLREYFAQKGKTNPFLVLDDNPLKKSFENEKGIGYSIVGALMKMGLFLDGMNVLVVGFGPVGRGTANYLRAVGSKVFIYDTNIKLMQKAKDLKFETEKVDKAIKKIDLIVTATGVQNALNRKFLQSLKNNTILVNAGAETGEWEREYLRKFPTERMNKFATRYRLSKNKIIIELGDGNSYNLVSGVSVSGFLDTTFSLAIRVIKKFLEKPILSGEFKLDRQKVIK